MTPDSISPEPQQQELPFATVDGKPWTELPTDLFIPPDALEVFLEAFEGPLDLLLWLIRRDNVDILDVPIADVARQYMAYVELMQEARFELAAEYLVMAAMLAEIKSRMLLPRPAGVEESDEGDPRAELVRRLMEYERYRNAAEKLSALPQMGRDLLSPSVQMPDTPEEPAPVPEVALHELLTALGAALERARYFRHHQVEREGLSVRERMLRLLDLMGDGNDRGFGDLLDPAEGRAGIVVTFLALLELVRESLLELSQERPFAPIHVRAAGS